MNALVVLYDACVLYPAPLRDLLMHLALTDLFRAKWTQAIHEEWINNVLANRPDLTRSQLERTRKLMDTHAEDCLVEGYEKWIPALTLPDMNDRHVLAAAICSSASIIVTFNIKDFPVDIVGEYGIEAQHRDDFICSLIDITPEIICSSIQRLRTSLKKPPIDPENYLKIIERQVLPKSADKLSKFVELI